MLRVSETMRTIMHPGPVAPERAVSRIVSRAPTIRLDLASGDDLVGSVEDRLTDLAAKGGSFVLVSGDIARLTIMTGGTGQDGLPMGFRGPHHLEKPLTVHAGAGSTGIDHCGAFFSHCHAVFRDSTGRLVGGHLIKGETIVGPQGATIDLMPLLDGRFARRDDPETGFTIFYPEAA